MLLLRSTNVSTVQMRIKKDILNIFKSHIGLWATAICLLINSSNIFAQVSTATNNIFLRPYKKNAIFYSKHQVGFSLKLKSNTPERQRGTISVDLKNASNGTVFHENISIYVGSRSSYSKDLDFGSLGLLSGIYTVLINVTTNAGVTTEHFSFVLNPESIQFKNFRPADFSNFWDETKRELAAVNPNYTIKKRVDLSNSRADVFTVEFQSLDNLTIRGFLTIPNKRGPFPVMCMFPDYVTEMKPEFMTNTAVLTVNVRGIGNSRDKIKAEFPQYLNLDVNNKKRFVYRGVYMDCYRSVDFILKQGHTLNLDTSQILLKGVGQGAGLCAVTAVLSPYIRGIIMERPLLLDIRNMIAHAELYKPAYWPATAMIEYCGGKISALTKDMFMKNWDYFDPVNFAPYIPCPILYGFAYKNNMNPSICSYNFLSQLRVDTKDILMCNDCETQMDDKFSGFQGTWINEILNIP